MEIGLGLVLASLFRVHGLSLRDCLTVRSHDFCFTRKVSFFISFSLFDLR